MIRLDDWDNWNDWDDWVNWVDRVGDRVEDRVEERVDFAGLKTNHTTCTLRDLFNIYIYQKSIVWWQSDLNIVIVTFFMW